MEQLLGLALFGSFIWLCVAAGLLLICFFWAEVAEEGWIAFTALCAFLVVNYFWGNVPLKGLVTWTNVLAYLGSGFVYAIIRTYFFGRRQRDRGYTNGLDIAKNELKDHVFRWWFLWPISLISWAVSDLVKEVWDFVYQKAQKGFEYFLELGFQSKKSTDGSKKEI